MTILPSAEDIPAIGPSLRMGGCGEWVCSLWVMKLRTRRAVIRVPVLWSPFTDQHGRAQQVQGFQDSCVVSYAHAQPVPPTPRAASGSSPQNLVNFSRGDILCTHLALDRSLIHRYRGSAVLHLLQWC
jgi:hypothetical protein